MTLVNFVRDSFWGRFIYHISGHKLFSYKEEQPDYVIPDKYLAGAKHLEMQTVESVSGSSSEVASISSSHTVANRIIVDWDGEDDPDNPKNWSLLKKAFFSAEISFLTISVYMASGIYTPGIEDLMHDLEVSRTMATLPLTMFVIGYGIGPMVFSPMSENAIFGRTSIYIVTLFIFFILQIPVSMVNDIASLTVLRFISGLFASPALATGGASMGDIVSPPYLPLVIALWSLACTCGPSFGPFFGAIMVQRRDWHWTFWLVAMAAGSAFVVLGWFLPETYEKTLLMRKAKRLRKVTGNPNITSPGEIENKGLTPRQLAVEILWRPIEIVFFEPIVLAIDVYIAFVYSIMYIWFEAFPIAYLEVYDFPMIPFGTTYLSVIVGDATGAFLYSWYVYRKVTIPGLRGEEIAPEIFMPPMIWGALLMPTGVFLFGWTVAADIHWFPSVLGAAIFSAGSFFVFQGGFSYLGSSFYHYLASVFAGSDLIRSVVAGCFPLFGTALYKNLGSEKFPVGWGSSVLGFIGVGMIAIPVVFHLRGPKLRAKSKYSSIE